MDTPQNFVEAGKQCSQQDVIDFMNATQSFMDKTEWVERYSWFGAMKEMQGVNEVIGCARYGVMVVNLLLVQQDYEHRWKN